MAPLGKKGEILGSHESQLTSLFPLNLKPDREVGRVEEVCASDSVKFWSREVEITDTTDPFTSRLASVLQSL